ncbi:MAG TPA: hypothetical protein PLJ42_02340 [Chitinophagales bacterium]|jgi:hypothetical protein|nr:hypothetical protein [Chitinophagales bacterium]MBP6154558.1 hypothetical protein [Chitinophagales bacterium]HQV77771.1 hypothetical protein [Chitinophagales bacterium]HQW78245.1 hypothetical protein [Chitinophagales bacterium]HRB18992.1 hypothetical protein [Chitinophagales bacterium]
MKNIKFLRYEQFDYPSGSALEYKNGILYVIGDDTNKILCLDDAWNEVQIIQLFEFNGERIPKPMKPDLECATIINDTLYILGSGSKSPERDVAFIIHLEDTKVKRISTAAFYSIFRNLNIVKELNIEGFTVCRDKLLFFNRANNEQSNLLICTDHKILRKQFPNNFKLIQIELPLFNNVALGISGACYIEDEDILLLTASAENTNNAYDDGEIIGSVIAVVKNAYQQLSNTKLVVEEVINLDTINACFKKQKIESICITKSKTNSHACVLVADNDDGKSTLFELDFNLSSTCKI